MGWKYTLAFLVIFGVVVLLRYVQDSPIRSWKMVGVVGSILFGLAIIWIQWVFPPPLPPQPRSERLENNRAELERTFRRIEGVSHASVTATGALLDFRAEKSLAELRMIAQHAGGASAYFLGNGRTNTFRILIAVQGTNRLELEFPPSGGIKERLF